MQPAVITAVNESTAFSVAHATTVATPVSQNANSSNNTAIPSKSRPTISTPTSVSWSKIGQAHTNRHFLLSSKHLMLKTSSLMSFENRYHNRTIQTSIYGIYSTVNTLVRYSYIMQTTMPLSFNSNHKSTFNKLLAIAVIGLVTFPSSKIVIH